MSVPPPDQHGTPVARFRALEPTKSDPLIHPDKHRPSALEQQRAVQRTGMQTWLQEKAAEDKRRQEEEASQQEAQRLAQERERGMQTWLFAKTQEDKRKQEEERTQQELLRLEQRKIEHAMLRQCLEEGIPPSMVPMVFSALKAGRASNDDAYWPQTGAVAHTVQPRPSHYASPSMHSIPEIPQNSTQQMNRHLPQHYAPPSMHSNSDIHHNPFQQMTQQRPLHYKSPSMPNNPEPHLRSNDSGRPQPQPRPPEPDAQAHAQPIQMRPIFFNFYTPPKAGPSRTESTPPSKKARYSRETSQESGEVMLNALRSPPSSSAEPSPVLKNASRESPEEARPLSGISLVRTTSAIESQESYERPRSQSSAVPSPVERIATMESQVTSEGSKIVEPPTSNDEGAKNDDN